MFFLDPYRFDAGSDPYYGSVSLLLHFEGTVGTATFTDSGPLALSPTTITGTPQLSSTQVAMGSASGKWASGDSVAWASSGPWVFGTGDFTIEFRYYDTNTVGSDNGLMCTRDGVIVAGWLIDAVPGFLFYKGPSDDGLIGIVTPLNTWTAVAFCRVSGIIYAFADGVLINSVAHTADITVATPLLIGQLGWRPPIMSGYIDELRITKGVGRYTADYTVSTLPFPNF